jgi:histidinol-phosphatase (PHP family)
MKICDLHIHSENSFDAENSVEELCSAAISRNLYAAAITDHCEAPFIKCGEDCEFGSFDRQIPKSIADTIAAKEKFSSKLKILCGIELAEPMHDLQCTEQALAYGEFDFILASVHNLRGEPDFYYIDFTKRDEEKLLNMYFEELIETSEFKHFDSLAHLTYPLRYIKVTTGKIPNLSIYQDKIDEIYKILIKNNKALEINVSGLFKELGTTLPEFDQIKRFRELGGQYVTIGTDAHKAEFVGKGIEQGIELAKLAGFSSYTIFEKHTPILIPIE